MVSFISLAIGIPHCSKDDVTIQGFDIPKGTLIIPNLWNLFREPKTWEKPEEFYPAHFLAEDGSFQKREEFIPFMTGMHVFKFLPSMYS